MSSQKFFSLKHDPTFWKATPSSEANQTSQKLFSRVKTFVKYGSAFIKVLKRANKNILDYRGSARYLVTKIMNQNIIFDP